MIDKETKWVISIAEKPGSFGVGFHNRGYEKLGLNYTYHALKVDAGQLEGVVQLVRDNFHGCSVSMPHKIEVIKYLDDLDESAQKTGAVNTILNQNGRLIGYNTDYYGAKKAIETIIGDISEREVVMVGAGGVARAVGAAINDLNGRLSIVNRTPENGRDLASKLGVEFFPLDKKENMNGYLLINATRVGLDNPEEMVIDENLVNGFNAVMDVVIPETKLIKTAGNLGKEVVRGRIMTTYQAVKQFEIYTGKELDKEFIEETLRSFGK